MALLVFTVIISLVVSSNYAFSEESSQTSLAEYYGKVLDGKIHQCLSKASLKNSKSPVLRDRAELEMEKAAFLSSNKNGLIEGMLEQGIGKKLYKIDFYLNREFFDSKSKLAKTDGTGGYQKN